MERYYNREAEIKYKKAIKNIRLSLYATFGVIGIVSLAILLFSPLEFWINLIICAVIALGICWLSMRFIIKIPVLNADQFKKEAYGEEVELTATNPIFEEMINDHRTSAQIFKNSLAPKPWKIAYTDDHWGNIYVTFKKGKNTMDLEFSDTQITVIFNKETEAAEYTQPLENFSNCIEVSDYIHKLLKDYFSK